MNVKYNTIIIIRINGIFYIITSGYMFRVYLFEPKHVAGSSNVKYTINPNNNYYLC